MESAAVIGSSTTYDVVSETFYMLYIYPKNAQEDLTPIQKRLLARLVREEFK